MYLFIKWIHIIAAMVYFGLPFAFGRWFQSCTLGTDSKPLADALSKINLFVRLHLNLCALVLLLSGLYLAEASQVWQTALWPVLSIPLLVLTLANANLLLMSPINQLRASLNQAPPDPQALRSVRIRLAWFSALHHTLVTLLTALMVFRP